MITPFEPRPASRRARLTALTTSLTLRPVATRLPANALGVLIARQIVAASMTTFGTRARRTTVESVDLPIPGSGRLKGEWVRAGETRTDAAILYFHGSGYALCSTRTHRGLTSQISALTGLPVFSVDYRLAPRHRFPAAADDVRRAFDWLVEHHAAPERIVLMGDSAGGHLAIDLCLEQVRHGGALPAAQVLMSPLADVTFALARQREQIRRDPMASAASAKQLLDHYTVGVAPDEQRLHHRVGAGEVLPPTLIQAGGAEMLAADAHHLHRTLLESGTDSTLEVWPGQMHVFQALSRVVPEARPAVRRAAAFVAAALDGALERPVRAGCERMIGFGSRRSRDARAVVTGSGSGIGQAFAVELARRGGRVVCSDIDETAAQRTVDAITDQGGAAKALRCDVGSAEEVAELAREAQAWFDGPPTLVINNAGVGAGGQRVGDIPLDDWEWTLGINLWGVIHGCHTFAPILRQAGAGGIINVASAASFSAAPRMAAYNVSKAGVLALSETLAAEMSGTGVRVSVLCPTFVKTNIVGSGRITADSSDLAAHLMRLTGMSPAKVAATCLDQHDRGALHILPQLDAKAFWQIKRHLPHTYTRGAGLLGRLAPQTDSTDHPTDAAKRA